MRHTLAGIERDLEEVGRARVLLDQTEEVLQAIRHAALGLGQVPEFAEPGCAPTPRLAAPGAGADDHEREGSSLTPGPAEDPEAEPEEASPEPEVSEGWRNCATCTARTPCPEHAEEAERYFAAVREGTAIRPEPEPEEPETFPPGSPEAEGLLDRINDGDPETIRAQHGENGGAGTAINAETGEATPGGEALPPAPRGPDAASLRRTYTTPLEYSEWCEQHPGQARNDRDVRRLVELNPGYSAPELARLTLLGEASVSNSLRRLCDTGELQRERRDGSFRYWTTEERDRIEAERYGKSDYHNKRVARAKLRESIEEMLRDWPTSVLAPEEVEVASHLGADRTEVAFVLGAMLEEDEVVISDGRYRLASAGATV